MNRFTTWGRRKLVQLIGWIERKMLAHPDYDRQDPEWIAMQNEAILLKRDLKKQLEESQRTK